MLCVRVREKSKAEKEAARPSAPSTKLKKKELHDDLDMAEKVWQFIYVYIYVYICIYIYT